MFVSWRALYTHLSMGSTSGMVLYFKKLFCQAYFLTLSSTESNVGLFSYIWDRIIPLHMPQPMPFYLLDDVSSVYANGHCYTDVCSTVLVVTSLSLGITYWRQTVIWYVHAHVVHLQHGVPCFLPLPPHLKISSKNPSYFPVPSSNLQYTEMGCGLDAALSRIGLMSIPNLLLLVSVSKDGLCRGQGDF